MNQQLWAHSNSMSLDIWDCLKWNIFAWTLNIGQTPANKDHCKKADLYVNTEEKNKDLEAGRRFLDCDCFHT